MGFKQLLPYRDDSSHRGQAKWPLDEGDSGGAMKVPDSKSGGSERVIPPTASKQESAPIPRKGAWKRKVAGRGG